MAITVIDIERRLELAALELLAACTELVALVGAAARIRKRVDVSAAAAYPAVWVQGIGFRHAGHNLGWYRGGLQLGAMTYRTDDKSGDTAKQILGALRGWAQQTDLTAQLNGTAAAQATATVLQIAEAWLDEEDTPFDFGDDRFRELVLPVSVVCRPSRAVTT